jgi:molybdopterin-binding protein
MNQLLAKITKIENVDNLNLVHFDCNGTKLTMMSLELNKNIKVGVEVVLNIKSTAITIGKGISGELSISNKLNANIESIEVGKLLSRIEVKVINKLFETIVTNDTLQRLDLQVGQDVDIFIKASELSISEVIDG